MLQTGNSNLHVSRWSSYIRVRPTSVRLTRRFSCPPSSPPCPSKRGRISSFSSDSRRRLRDALSLNTLPNSHVYGVTFTVPWRDISVEDAVVRYSYLWHLFSVNFRRTFSNCACIFRHEMQRRRMPHTHIVLYSYDDISVVSMRFTSLWLRCLRQTGLYGGSESSAMRYGVKVDSVDDGSISLYRYLSDHASKSKQAQLGFPGKQWGYLNRSLFIVNDECYYKFENDRDLINFTRHLSKLCRFSVPIDLSPKSNRFKCFRFKKVPRRKVCSVTFCDSATVARLALFCHARIYTFDEFPREYIVAKLSHVLL